MGSVPSAFTASGAASARLIINSSDKELPHAQGGVLDLEVSHVGPK